MGVWDYFCSATETVKQYTPDLTPVKTICGHGWSAVTKVDNAVRVVAVGKLSHYWRDEQARSDLTRFAADFTKNTGVYVIEEGVKTVPGGAPVYKIFCRSLKSGGNKKCGDKKLEVKDEKIKELSARIEKLEQQSRDSSSSKLHEQTEIQSPDLGLKSSNTIHSYLAPNQSPEDVIRVFMMKEFIGTRFLDDLIVPKVGNKKKT